MKSVYVALGVNFEGKKEVLGLWIAENEGAKFWMGVLTELKNRGVQDILIACMDGLSGFPEAVRAVYPQTRVQLCADFSPVSTWCATRQNSFRIKTWKKYAPI